MRIFKFGVLAILLVLGIYAVSMYYLVDERKSYRFEKQISYPIEKVFPQFNNLQNFTRWNDYFASSKTMTVAYYAPYEGKGAALSFQDEKTDRSGELFIRYHNPNRTLRLQVFEGRRNNPTLVDIKFTKADANSTRIIWNIHTPKQRLLKRISNLWTEDDFVENLDKSMANLNRILSNKVEKDHLLTAVTYDSLMVEKQEGQLLLGINVSTSNRKDALFRNIILNHNKVHNFVLSDLGKREDEFGHPVLLTDPDNFKDNEVSYFIGIPLSKREGVSDNNFSFRTVNGSEGYVLYYRGPYPNRTGAIQKLLQQARRDSMRNGELQQVFLETPETGKDVLLKLILPVYR